MEKFDSIIVGKSGELDRLSMPLKGSECQACNKSKLANSNACPRPATHRGHRVHEARVPLPERGPRRARRRDVLLPGPESAVFGC
jgi:hypothetical protein